MLTAPVNKDCHSIKGTVENPENGPELLIVTIKFDPECYLCFTNRIIRGKRKRKILQRLASACNRKVEIQNCKQEVANARAKARALLYFVYKGFDSLGYG